MLSRTDILIEEEVEPLGQALPEHLEQRQAQQLLQLEQVIPQAQQHGTRRAGQ